MKNWPSMQVATKFKNTFKRELKEFWSPLTGFDVLKFDDEVVKPPDGTSTKQHLLNVHGEEVMKFVERLVIA